ncbi:DUF1800 domain-containing protein [Thiolapillus sp.]
MAALFSAGLVNMPTSRASTHSSKTLPTPDPDILTLNRSTFGISTELVEEMRRLGRENWLEQQMDWESIDDRETDDFLHRQMPTLFMSERELAALPSMGQAANQLKQATIYRAMYSNRQLYEVMVEFWSNHFSIYHRDGPVTLLKTLDDRNVIRPHALGNFRELLHASSKSPAMLVYLDNHTNFAGTPNENYARELMELHTLGVNGGYTETDVQEVARCFTGWAVGRRGSDKLGKFQFYPRRHDQGEKTVLGTTIPAKGGIRDGERVIDLLAGHPSTARFISTKLARHFVSDEPPTSLVVRLTRVFLDTDGDIRSLLWEIFRSNEFLQSADLKLKRPMEYIIGALRSTGAKPGPTAYRSLREYLFALGQIPFDWVPPDGYPDVADYWISTNGLLNRWNFASALAGSRLPGIRLDYLKLIGRDWHPAALVDRLADRLLHRPLLVEDRQLFTDYLARGKPASKKLSTEAVQERIPGLIGLMLSSDYFQYR